MVFTPYRIRNAELKNRWIMLAMHTGFAQGFALTERDLAYYEERAKGGAAAVTCLLAVNPAGALKGMYDAVTVERDSLKALADRVHQYDCKLIVQLFHCGRNESGKTHGDRPLLAPSAVPSPIFRTEPKAMIEAELDAKLRRTNGLRFKLIAIFYVTLPCIVWLEKLYTFSNYRNT